MRDLWNAWKYAKKALADAVEEFARAGVVREALLLGSKFAGVRLQPASRRADRMLRVQHFVVQDEFHGVCGHIGAIEALVHHDLVERRIVAAELGAPNALAPSDPRARKIPAEILRVEGIEHRPQIVRLANGVIPDAAAPLAADQGDMRPGGMRKRELAVISRKSRGTRRRYLPEQDRGDGFNHRDRRLVQNIRKPHVGGVRRRRTVCGFA